MINCYICGNNQIIEQHHVVLQAAGGKEGPTVPLCKNCHGLVHKIAMNLESKSPNIHVPYTKDEWNRAKTIVKYIQLSIRKNRNNPNMNDPAKLTIDLTKRELYLLHLIKTDAGETNLNNYVARLLRNLIQSKFPGESG